MRWRSSLQPRHPQTGSEDSAPCGHGPQDTFREAILYHSRNRIPRRRRGPGRGHRPAYPRREPHRLEDGLAADRGVQRGHEPRPGARRNVLGHRLPRPQRPDPRRARDDRRLGRPEAAGRGLHRPFRRRDRREGDEPVVRSRPRPDRRHREDRSLRRALAGAHLPRQGTADRVDRRGRPSRGLGREVRLLRPEAEPGGAVHVPAGRRADESGARAGDPTEHRKLGADELDSERRRDPDAARRRGAHGAVCRPEFAGRGEEAGGPVLPVAGRPDPGTPGSAPASCRGPGPGGVRRVEGLLVRQDEAGQPALGLPRRLLDLRDKRGRPDERHRRHHRRHLRARDPVHARPDPLDRPAAA